MHKCCLSTTLISEGSPNTMTVVSPLVLLMCFTHERLRVHRHLQKKPCCHIGCFPTFPLDDFVAVLAERPPYQAPFQFEQRLRQGEQRRSTTILHITVETK